MCAVSDSNQRAPSISLCRLSYPGLPEIKCGLELFAHAMRVDRVWSVFVPLQDKEGTLPSAQNKLRFNPLLPNHQRHLGSKPNRTDRPLTAVRKKQGLF